MNNLLNMIPKVKHDTRNIKTYLKRV